MMKKNKKGFTILEGLALFSAVGVASSTALSLIQERDRTNYRDGVAEELRMVVSAVEKRLLIDGYTTTNWNNFSWSSTDFETFKMEEMIASNQNCLQKDGSVVSGDWIPKLNEEKNSKLIPCDLWKGRLPYEMNLEMNLIPDTFGFIESFEVLLTFNDKAHFEKNIIDISYLSKNEKSHTKTADSIYSVELVNRITKLPLTASQCMNLETGCALLASFNRDDSSEYLRSDGYNPVVGEHFKFIETSTSSPLMCVKWSKDASNNWSSKLSESCGIGVYNKTGYPVMVDVVAENGTYENVMLDTDCNNYIFNAGIVEIDGQSPCGMTKKGAEYYQVIDNIEAVRSVIEDVKFEAITSNSLVSSTLSTQTADATTLLKAVKAEIGTNGLTVIGGTQLHGLTTADIVRVNLASGSIGNFDNINTEIAALNYKNNLIDLEINKLWNSNNNQDNELRQIRNEMNNFISTRPNVSEPPPSPPLPVKKLEWVYNSSCGSQYYRGVKPSDIGGSCASDGQTGSWFKIAGQSSGTPVYVKCSKVCLYR